MKSTIGKAIWDFLSTRIEAGRHGGGSFGGVFDLIQELVILTIAFPKTEKL
jgi:hypothetical protein